MRKVLLIARREYGATIRTKGFIIGLLLAPLLMGGSLIVFAIFKDRVDTDDRKLAIVDRSGLVAEALAGAAERRNANAVFDRETGKKVRPSFVIEIVEPDDEHPDAQRLALSDRIRNGDLHAFLEVGPGILHPDRDAAASRLAYHSRNPALDETRRWLEQPINSALRNRRLEEAGVNPADVPDLFHYVRTEGLGLVSLDEKTGEVRPAERRDKLQALLLPLAMPMLLFVMILMGAQPRLNSVMEEKSQRIAEVLLGSIEPFPFMVGKLAGGLAVALTAAAVYLGGGLIVLEYMGLGSFVPYHVLPWFLTYLVLAIVMFGAMFSAVGAACNDPSEAQSVAFPAMIPVIFPLFIQMPVVTQPDSAFATGMSLVPPFTPMLMLIRQATPGGVPAWQPWVGLAGVLLMTLLLVWAGGRIFRVGLLTSGTPPKVKNLLRWAIRG